MHTGTSNLVWDTVFYNGKISHCAQKSYMCPTWICSFSFDSIGNILFINWNDENRTLFFVK